MDRIKIPRWICLIKVVGWLAFSILAHFDKLGANFPYRHMFALTAYIIFLNAIGELLNEIFD